MASKRMLGLVTLKVGPIANDGGMGTTLVTIGDTVKDSCVFSEGDATKQEFFIEESDDAVESIITQKGVEAVNWSTSNLHGRNMALIFGGTHTPYKSIATVGTLTPGSGYANGTYTNVPLTGGTGKEAEATIVVASGAVTTVTITYGGEGYTSGDDLSALAANMGGTGSGFVIEVSTLNNSNTASTWEPPDTQNELERSIEIVDRKGNKVEIVRAKFAPKKSFSFQSSKLGQVDITATILLPTKDATKKFKITYAN
jgi:hypothetical protein